MITPKVHLTLPEHFDEDDRDEERHFAPIIPLLEGLIKVNEWHLRRSLRRAQKGLAAPIQPLYASGVRYKEDPPGQENWKDIPAVLKDGHGDCLPLSTLVLRATDGDVGELVPMLALKVGDRVMGDGNWTTVREVCVTGGKRVRVLSLDNGCALRSSREHKVFRLMSGNAREEIRVDEVKIGDALVTPTSMPARLCGTISVETSRPVLHAIANATRSNRNVAHRVERISEAGSELCMDITTDSGVFWLPEPDVLVHNCDRLVAWRVAELRVAGHAADPVIKWRTVPKDVMIGLGHPAHMVPENGIQMVHVCVGLPGWRQYAHLYEQNPLVEDPSKRLGMGGSYTSKV